MQLTYTSMWEDLFEPMCDPHNKQYKLLWTPVNQYSQELVGNYSFGIDVMCVKVFKINNSTSASYIRDCIIISSDPTSASWVTVLRQTTTKKNISKSCWFSDFLFVADAYTCHVCGAWFNGSHPMAAKPIKTLDSDYLVIQFSRSMSSSLMS